MFVQNLNYEYNLTSLFPTTIFNTNIILHVQRFLTRSAYNSINKFFTLSNRSSNISNILKTNLYI